MTSCGEHGAQGDAGGESEETDGEGNTEEDPEPSSMPSVWFNFFKKHLFIRLTENYDYRKITANCYVTNTTTFVVICEKIFLDKCGLLTKVCFWTCIHNFTLSSLGCFPCN